MLWPDPAAYQQVSGLRDVYSPAPETKRTQFRSDFPRTQNRVGEAPRWLTTRDLPKEHQMWIGVSLPFTQRITIGFPQQQPFA